MKIAKTFIFNKSGIEIELKYRLFIEAKYVIYRIKLSVSWRSMDRKQLYVSFIVIQVMQLKILTLGNPMV